MKSPGKPSLRRDIERLFWHEIAKGLSSEETARAYASNKGVVGRGIDSVKSSRGQATTDLGKLEVDRDYGRSARRF